MEAQLLYKARGLFEALEQMSGDPGDLSNTMKHIAQTAQKFFHADACFIFAMNPITQRFTTSQAVVGDMLKSNKVTFEPPKPELLTQQFLERGIIVVEDLELML